MLFWGKTLAFSKKARVGGSGKSTNPNSWVRVSSSVVGVFHVKGGGGQKSGEKTTNKLKQLCGIVPEMGGGQIVYVFPFFLEKGKHINKILRKSQEKAGRVPGQSRENPGTIPRKFCLCVFLFIGFFPGPKKVWYVLRNPKKPNFLAGYPWIFAGFSRGRPKSLRRESLCSILVPKIA